MSRTRKDAPTALRIADYTDRTSQHRISSLSMMRNNKNAAFLKKVLKRQTRRTRNQALRNAMTMYSEAHDQPFHEKERFLVNKAL